MADGKQVQRGQILKGKLVMKWMNYKLLEDMGFIRRIESPEKE